MGIDDDNGMAPSELRNIRETMDADVAEMAQKSEAAELANEAYASSQCGAGVYAGAAYMPSPAQIEAARVESRRCEALSLRQSALGYALQYGRSGAHRSSQEVVDDAQRFLQFLQVE